MKLEESKILEKFFRKAYGLRNVDRCSTLPKFRQNNVAEHSYFFCLLVYVLGEIENWIKPKDQEPLDIGLMLKRSILHDLEECLTGDVLYSTHQASAPFRNELLKLRERVVTEELFKELEVFGNKEGDQFSFEYYFFDNWLKAKDETPEGRFLYYIDKLELLFVAVEEIRMGNTYFRGIREKCYNILKESKFETIAGLALQLMKIQVVEDLYNFSKE